MPLITVITPCYNHGVFLDEACESLNQKAYPSLFEHIIVNDGSTDSFTLSKLKEYEVNGNVKVIHQSNKGLAIARNAAIMQATGKYILPLDSDNKIIPEVFAEAVDLMEQNSSLDVVHTYAYLFGERSGIWEIQEFDYQRMFFENYIDACALIRKSTLLKAGMYSIDMPVMGHEDWELWLKLGERGKFLLLKKPGFYYRVLASSMVNQFSNPHVDKSQQYILTKHHQQFLEQYRDLYAQSLNYKNLLGYEQIRATAIRKRPLKAIAKVLLGKSL